MKINSKIPVQFGELINQVSLDEEKRNESIQASIFIDDSAPADLQALIRSSFASAAANARITISYMGSVHAIPDPADDMAVIVAGADEGVGTLAGEIRGAGVPVMVVTTMPLLVRDLAAAQGDSLPQADILHPSVDLDPFGEGEVPQEPIALDDPGVGRLRESMGRWIVQACPSKKLAFAFAFPFVRKPLALESVNLTAIENAGIGLLVVLPGADMPIMTLNQAKMALQIAAAYGEPLNRERVGELLAIGANALIARGFSRRLAGLVPVLGFAVKSGVGYGATIAVGRLFIEYFENGGGVTGVGKTASGILSGLAVAISNATKSGEEEPEPEVEKTPQEKAAEQAQLWSGRVKGAADLIGKAAGPLASNAAKVGADTFTQGMKQIFKQ